MLSESTFQTLEHRIRRMGKRHAAATLNATPETELREYALTWSEGTLDPYETAGPWADLAGQYADALTGRDMVEAILPPGIALVELLPEEVSDLIDAYLDAHDTAIADALAALAAEG